MLYLKDPQQLGLQPARAQEPRTSDFEENQLCVDWEGDISPACHVLHVVTFGASYGAVGRPRAAHEPTPHASPALNSSHRLNALHVAAEKAHGDCFSCARSKRHAATRPPTQAALSR